MFEINSIHYAVTDVDNLPESVSESSNLTEYSVIDVLSLLGNLTESVRDTDLLLGPLTHSVYLSPSQPVTHPDLSAQSVSDSVHLPQSVSPSHARDVSMGNSMEESEIDSENNCNSLASKYKL